MNLSIDLAKRVERMVDACRAWNAQFEVFIAPEIAKRHAFGRSLTVVLKALIGLAFVPPTNAPRRIVLFQGLRYKFLFPQFANDEIYLLGSWIEREEARKNGYGFIPVFPIENAIRLAVYRGITLAALQQARRWTDWIADRKVTAIIYEDTQPMGAFLALLSDPDSPYYRAVCIQHGHYNVRKSPYRPEGRLTEYNLVWDTQQGEFISANPSKTRAVGLPYQAASQQPTGSALRVIFVGLGSTSHHKESVEIFSRIAVVLHRKFRSVKLSYRPHPNEFYEPDKIAECERVFGLIDRTPKVELLNGPWALFVGEVSSLLYEAKQAGHLTAFVPIDPINLPMGYHDITVDPNDLDTMLETLQVMLDAPPPLPSNSAATGDPVARFIAGAVSLGLITKAGRDD